MTDTVMNHPVFDTLAAQFEEEFGYPLFTVVVKDSDARYQDGLDEGQLPVYESFISSYPGEWLLYHSPNTNAVELIDVWYPSGLSPDPDFPRPSISEALALVQSPEDNTALDAVMDVIFGERDEVEEDDPFFLNFRELREEDMRAFLERANEELKAEEAIITPKSMVARAKQLYLAAPIKPMKPVALEVEPQPVNLVEIIEHHDEVIEEAIDSTLTELKSEDDAAQEKFNSFWNKQV